MNIYSRGIFLTCISFCLVGTVMPVTAQPQGGFQPPKAAFEVCTGKKEGNECTFTGRMNNEVKGTCRELRRHQGKMVCVPNPLPQQFEACKDKKAGDACTFTGRLNRSIDGTCRSGPRSNGKLFCGREMPKQK